MNAVEWRLQLLLSAFVLSLQWCYCLWEGLLWIQVESYWKCSQDHSECQSADRQTEGALWTSGNYKLFFLVGVLYAGCLVPPLVWGKYGDRIPFSVLKVRRGTAPNRSNFCGASVTCCWRQSHHLIDTEQKQYICDSLSLPGSGHNSHLAEGMEGGRELMRFTCGRATCLH